MALIESGIMGEFPYAIQYNDRVGHLCGYIGVPQGHPWYGKDYDDVECEVHGGLTYGSESDDEYPCPLPVKVWWFGFDCGHLYDRTNYSADGTYRDRDYVYRELEGMASQASEQANLRRSDMPAWKL